MEESEKQPLLDKENKDAKPEDSTCPNTAESRKRGSKCGIIIGMACSMIIICAAIGGTIAFGVKFTRYKNNDLECQKINHGLMKDVQSRSGSYSILDTITSQDLTCYAKPQLLVLLEDRDSSVEIYQTLCENIETQPFHVNYHFNDLPSAKGPRPLFDENFSSENYFMNGNMQVEIINATTTFPSRDIHLCLFSDYYEYNSFLTAGIKWKNHTESATACITVTAAKNDETNEMVNVLFNITEPTFAFLAMATTYPTQIDLINITAIGQDISSLSKNSTKVCQLNGEGETCNLSLPNKQLSKNQSICIVAHEEGNPDGTYDYSNITISTPNQVKHDNPYKMKLTIYGSVFLGIIVISLTVILIGTVVWKLKIFCNRQNRSQLTTRHHSVQNAKVTCSPVAEDTTQHHPKSERLLVPVTGSDQLQQMIQKHQSPGEGIPVNQDVALRRSSDLNTSANK